MGFRWALATAKAGSPFDCASCTQTDIENRNCGNRHGLSDSVRATEYSDEDKSEILEKRVKKVISLGSIRLYECPLSFITSDTRDIVNLVFLIAESHHLLHAGGWGGQPSWLVEAYQVYKVEAISEQKRNKEADNGGKKY